MHRFKRLFVIGLVAYAMLGQSASLMINPEVRRIGMKLACLCKSCKNAVGDCQMIGCHYAAPAREQIAQMSSAGASDESILAKFTQRDGLRALAVPPTSGFSLTIWIMPFVMLAMGLYAIYVYVKRFRRPAPAAAIPASHRHQDLAARELDKLD